MKRFVVFATVAALAGFASSAFAQQRESSTLLLNTVSVLLIEEVQTELKLTTEQKQKLQALGFDENAIRTLRIEDRLQRRRDLAEKAEETIKTVLDETQQERLEELQIQHQGAYSLTHSAVTAKLGLDQTQKDKIRQFSVEYRKNRLKNYRNYPRAPIQEQPRKYLEERQKYYAEVAKIEEKLSIDLLGILTDAQKESFQEMQGEKFNFPERRRNNNN